jgi:hypothetical protein
MTTIPNNIITMIKNLVNTDDQITSSSLYTSKGKLGSFLRKTFNKPTEISKVLFENKIYLNCNGYFFPIKKIHDDFSFVIKRNNKFDIYYNINDKYLLVYDPKTCEGFTRFYDYKDKSKIALGTKRYALPDNQTTFYLHSYNIESIINGFPSERILRRCMDENTIVKILNHNFPLRKLPSYSSLRQHNSINVRSIINYIENNKLGGIKYYTNLVTNNGFQFEDNVYTTDNGDIVRSEYEFYLFSILHKNNIPYVYEPKNLKSLLPDFYIPSKNFYIELSGLCGQKKYDSKVEKKKQMYDKLNLNVHFINPIHSKAFKTIFEQVNNIFDDSLIEPNFFEYTEKFMLGFDEFINKVKELCVLIQNGTYTPNQIHLEYPSKYTKYVFKVYGTWRRAIIDLLNEVPSKYASTSNKYYLNEDNVITELKLCKKIHGDIPDLKKCNELYNGDDFSVNVILYLCRMNTTNIFRKGGKYYGWIPYYKDKEKVTNIKIKFSDDEINDIIIKRKQGITYRKIAEYYGVSAKKIYSILNVIVSENVTLTMDIQMMEVVEEMEPQSEMK